MADQQQQERHPGKIKVPQQEIVVQKHFGGNCSTCGKTHKNDFTITMFGCQGEDGTFMGSCQAFGDRKAQLEEVMGKDQFLEVEDIKHNQQYNRWDIKFPGGSGSDANYRKGQYSGGGGDRYKGQAVPFDTYWKVSADCAKEAKKIVDGILTADEKKDPAYATARLGMIQTMVNSYWMNSAKNITFATGFEPKWQQKDSSSSDSGTSSPSSSSSDNSGNKREETKKRLAGEIESCKMQDSDSDDAKKAKYEKTAKIFAEINESTDIENDDRSELHGELFPVKKELKKALGIK